MMATLNPNLFKPSSTFLTTVILGFHILRGWMLLRPCFTATCRRIMQLQFLMKPTALNHILLPA
jgi:hypothetical protein